jgi:hypothetical protein
MARISCEAASFWGLSPVSGFRQLGVCPRLARLARRLRYADWLDVALGRLDTGVMRPLFASLFLVAASTQAADIPLHDFRSPMRDGMSVVGIDCDRGAGALEVRLFHPGSPPSKAMDLWRTVSLVTLDKTSFNYTAQHHVERRCMLGRDRYRVRLTGVPGALNAQWQCGALVHVQTKVWKNGRMVFDQQFGDCSWEPGKTGVRFVAGAAPQVD